MKLNKIKIIFVCLANYCRSPMAEAIFNTLAENDGIADYFEVSSAGTKNWDVGLRPDARSQRLMANHAYHLSPHKRAQKITPEEIHSTNYLIAMDQRIADELGNGKNVHLLLDFVNHIDDKDIQDPYPTDTFEEAFTLIELGIKNFYEYLKQKHVPIN